MKRFVLSVLLLATQASAIPLLVNYQGQLTSSGGTPLDTTVSIAVRMYTGAVGGAQLWAETHSAVPVADGQFQVSLGELSSLTDVIFNQPQVWLGVTIGSDSELSPRTQLTSVAYSYYTGTVHAATGGTVTGDVTILGKGNIGTGNANTGSGAFVAGSNNFATGQNSTVGGGTGNIAENLAAVVSGGASNFARGAYSTVAGGGGTTLADSNLASGDYSVVSGGAGNAADGFVATIAGGSRNIASGSRAAIGGGRVNRARGDFSVVAGGGGTALADSNSANFPYGTIGGGQGNHILADYGTISGGLGNEVGWSSAVVGGEHNAAQGNAAFIGGGVNNYARGPYSVICGGGNAVASDSNAIGTNGWYSFIGGGHHNTVSNPEAVVVGGVLNHAEGHAFVGGGYGNDAAGNYSAIGAGASNTASGAYSTIGAGRDNATDDTASTVAGGRYCRARGRYSSVLGGGGYNAADSNSATGDWSTVLGGRASRATADYAIALGRKAVAMHTGSIVITDGNDIAFNSTADNQCIIRASGGTTIYSAALPFSGVSLAAGGNAWVGVSDSTRKRDIRLTDTRSVLAKVSSLPVKDWEYKSEAIGVEHMGPMAQDFWNAFHLGSDSLGIATNDADGVLFAAVRELAQRNAELSTAVRHHEARLLELEARLDKIASATAGGLTDIATGVTLVNGKRGQ
ncbi:tail fiber domain-containing protein [candidate division KSB1 bacterium]|nr:tail fiber domain-containing protein [candidate division KSB1 bacterium]